MVARSVVAGAILGVGLYLGPLYVAEELEWVAIEEGQSRAYLVAGGVETAGFWDLQSAALELASALTSTASATSLI